MRRWKIFLSIWSEQSPARLTGVPLLVWNDPRVSAAARTLIEDPARRKLVSIATCWEIAIKAGLGKLRLGSATRDFFVRELASNRFDLLPIVLEHAAFVTTLPRHHRDPFERLLVAQSLIEGIPIVSADAVFDAYAINRVR